MVKSEQTQSLHQKEICFDLQNFRFILTEVLRLTGQYNRQIVKSTMIVLWFKTNLI